MGLSTRRRNITIWGLILISLGIVWGVLDWLNLPSEIREAWQVVTSLLDFFGIESGMSWLVLIFGVLIVLTAWWPEIRKLLRSGDTNLEQIPEVHFSCIKDGGYLDRLNLPNQPKQRRLRLTINVDRGQKLKDCRVALTKAVGVKGVIFNNQKVLLPFVADHAHGVDPRTDTRVRPIDVVGGVEEKVELVELKGNKFEPMFYFYANSPIIRLLSAINSGAVYLTLVVWADNLPSKEIELKFDWTGDAESSSLSLHKS